MSTQVGPVRRRKRRDPRRGTPAAQHGGGPYPLALRLKAVKLHEEEGFSRQLIVQETGVSKNTLREWVKRYRAHGEAGLDVALEHGWQPMGTVIRRRPKSGPNQWCGTYGSNDGQLELEPWNPDSTLQVTPRQRGEPAHGLWTKTDGRCLAAAFHRERSSRRSTSTRAPVRSQR